MQVKEFIEMGGSTTPLNSRVNEWLEKHEFDIDIIDIKYAVTYDPPTQSLKSSALVMWEFNGKEDLGVITK